MCIATYSYFNGSHIIYQLKGLCIIEYGSTLYVGMAPEKNGGPINVYKI